MGLKFINDEERKFYFALDKENKKTYRELMKKYSEEKKKKEREDAKKQKEEERKQKQAQMKADKEAERQLRKQERESLRQQHKKNLEEEKQRQRGLKILKRGRKNITVAPQVEAEQETEKTYCCRVKFYKRKIVDEEEDVEG